MMAVATLLEPGHSTASYRAGDFLLIQNRGTWHSRQGFTDGAIRHGQRRQMRPDLRAGRITRAQFDAWTERSHAVAISGTPAERTATGSPLSPAGTVAATHLVEALANGVERSPLDRYAGTGNSLYVATDLTEPERADYVGYVEGMVGVRYGFATIASIAISMQTGARFRFGLGNQVICSGLVAAALGVWEWRSDPSHVTPAQLGRYHETDRWQEDTRTA